MSDESQRKDKFLKAWASGAVIACAILLAILILRNCRESEPSANNPPAVKSP